MGDGGCVYMWVTVDVFTCGWGNGGCVYRGGGGVTVGVFTGGGGG